MNDHDLLIELRADVKHIRKKLDDICEEIGNHERRIGELERFKAKIIGAVSVLSVLAGYLTFWRH